MTRLRTPLAFKGAPEKARPPVGKLEHLLGTTKHREFWREWEAREAQTKDRSKVWPNEFVKEAEEQA